MPSAWPEGRLYCDTLISLADFLESILVDALFTCLCVHESKPSCHQKYFVSLCSVAFSLTWLHTSGHSACIQPLPNGAHKLPIICAAHVDH